MKYFILAGLISLYSTQSYAEQKTLERDAYQCLELSLKYDLNCDNPKSSKSPDCKTLEFRIKKLKNKWKNIECFCSEDCVQSL